ncbi:MAG: lysophospholipid acyltransferase family protein [Ignavibacteriaceae bacterium]|jgi:putative hemolysin|nr:lysophospholipid acyltransferase family protein [Ignavibacteriaceae bacterium]
MLQIDLNKILRNRIPSLYGKKSLLPRKVVESVLSRMMRVKKINTFLAKYEGADAPAFIDGLFEELDFSYSVSKKDKDKIPSEGKVVIVSNHPLGGLDGLALLKLVLEVRSDVKIVVNDILLQIENLKTLFLPYNLFDSGIQKENIAAIDKALKEESAVIFFPAGEVSRITLHGLQDITWTRGALHFAEKARASILPVFIKGKNTFGFYAVSAISKAGSIFLLPRELFKQRGKTINIKIGNLIPAKILFAGLLKGKVLSNALRKHVYQIGKNKKGIFLTERNVIHPIDPKKIKRQLLAAKLLQNIDEKKKVYLLSNNKLFPDVIKEIARLREVTFRKIGEGTGKKLDTDPYDAYYHHIVLWDEENLEIMGAYRVGVGSEIIEKYGTSGFYSSTLFNYSEQFLYHIPYSIELGRSFIQAKYWNTNALDYLWMGIGAFLVANPKVQFLFGPVSLTNNYPAEVKEMIVFFYEKWYGNTFSLVNAKNKFNIREEQRKNLSTIFSSNNYKEELKLFKQNLRYFGMSIPPLYKQYTALCEPGGAQFLDFGVDPDFQNCIDGFILIDIDLIKYAKKEKYIYSNMNFGEEAPDYLFKEAV